MLIRNNQKCEVFLSKFKKEICHNPYTDVTPYTEALAAAFKKWNKALEKDVINGLFLALYEHDAQSLRRDLCQLDPQTVLCKFNAPDEAKTKFPRRARLLSCIYHMLSWRLGENFSWVIEMCKNVTEMDQIKNEIDREKYLVDFRKNELELILSEFKKDVSQNPNIDLTIYINMLVSEYDITGTACAYRIYKTLFLTLYAQDAKSLERDLTSKIPLLISVKVTPDQRAELLEYLYCVLSSYVGEDFSSIIAKCDKVEDL